MSVFSELCGENYEKSVRNTESQRVDKNNLCAGVALKHLLFCLSRKVKCTRNCARDCNSQNVLTVFYALLKNPCELVNVRRSCGVAVRIFAQILIELLAVCFVPVQKLALLGFIGQGNVAVYRDNVVFLFEFFTEVARSVGNYSKFIHRISPLYYIVVVI